MSGDRHPAAGSDGRDDPPRGDPPRDAAMRDAVMSVGEPSPPSPELVLAILARVAAIGGGGVGVLLDAACTLGARAALIRAPAPAPAPAITAGPGADAPAAGDTHDRPEDDRPGDDRLGDDRLELTLGTPPASPGTLVLALPQGLLAHRPDLRHAFIVIAGLVARELEPGPGSRRTPAHGTAAHLAPAHGTSAHVTPAQGTPVHVTPAHVTPAHGTPAHAPDSSAAGAGAPPRADGEVVDNRLQRLREAATALGRVLDETEIYREVGRQLGRALPVDELLIARPAPHGGGFVVGFALRAGDERQAGGAVLSGDAAAVVLAEVARTGRPAHATDGADDHAPALVGVPMLAGLQLVGVLLVRRASFPAPADEELLRALGAQAATALVNAALYADSQRERRQTEALAEVARAVGSSLRLNEVLRLILRHASALLRVEGAYVALRSGEFLEIVAASGRAEVLRGLYLPENASLGGEVLRSGRAVVVNDVDGDPRTYRPTQRAVQAQRMLLAPLLTGDGAIGTLVVLNRVTPFDDGDARVLQRLADHVAVAIVNARLYEEVMESTREWTVAFDAIATGMLMLDARGRVERCNASALTLLGAGEARQVVGRPLGVVLLHEPSDEAAALLDLALRERTVARGTLRSRARGRVFEIVASPHPHGGAVLTVDDVTTLHSLTERYRMVVETAGDAIVITDPSRHVTFANPAAERLFGRPGGLVGLAVSSLVQPEQREVVAEHQRAALAGVAQSYETIIIGTGGGRRIVAVSTAPLRQLGDITGTVAMLRDITVERGARDAIADSEARYRNLFEVAADGICTVDATGRITSVNPALCRALGRTAAALVGVSMTELAEPEDRHIARQLLETTLTGEQVRGEVRYRDGQGRLRVGSIITSSIVEEGQITGALALVRDMSDERLLAAQLMQQEKLAAIGQLVSGVAHELNNPLGGIMAFSQLLLAGALQGDMREGAEIIHAEAARAAKIVGNLLTFARQQEPMRTAVDLNAVLRTVAQLRRYTLRSQQVELVLDLDAELPRTWADEHQLHQVVLNLVTNAEQAMEQRPQPRRLTLATAHAGHRLEIRVSDTGGGMDAARQSRIFNPFFTTKGVGRGTGLGLSIAHGIVREHGGELAVESELDVGTTFRVILPLAAAPERAAGECDGQWREGAAAPAAGCAALPRRVLVVDDEASIRWAMCRYLGGAGFEVEAVAGGRAALAALADARFDAILLDLRMPDLAGDVLYEMVRASDPAQAERIVFVTGDLRSDRARDFLASTGQPSVGKPFTFEELQEALERVMEPTSAGRHERAHVSEAHERGDMSEAT